jgi:membrane associated rhomboid family serine protease
MKQVREQPSLRQEFKTKAYLIVGLVALLWTVELVNLVLGHRLNVLGIHPRTVVGLPGILLAPFLHGGIGHVLVNTIPFVILGWLVILHGTGTFLEVSLIVILVAGAGTWLFGRPGVHVGASSLIFGYFGFLLGRAWYQRSVGSILVAVVTLALYGGLLWGVLPLHARISWEGHLFGLLGGVLAAWLQQTILTTSPSSPPASESSDGGLSDDTPHAALLERLDRLDRELEGLKPRGGSGDPKGVP